MVPLLAANAAVTGLSGVMAEATSGDPASTGYIVALIIGATGTAVSSILVALAQFRNSGRKRRNQSPADKRAEIERLVAELEEEAE